MNSNLIRKEKIELIKGLLNGRQLNQLLPKVKVFLIEHEQGEYFVDVDNEHLKGISVNEADQFIERLKIENRGKTVEVFVIDYKKYLTLSEEFELEY